MSHNSRTTWAIALILLVFAAGVYLSSRALLGRDGFFAGSRVAVLPVEGVITSERQVLGHLETFRRDGSVRAFVIEIRSPGGTVGASQSIYREIRKLREMDDRPIVAWMGDIAASGGYYVSLAADSVYALPGTLTGSIGVIMEFPNASELMRKVGVEWEVVKSGEHKDMGSPSRPLSDSDREILEGVVLDVWDQFVDAVADNRPIARAEVVALADGRIFSGEQAVELGLVDGIATLNEAIDAAGRMAGLGERPQTLRPRPRRVRWIDLLLGLTETKARHLLEILPSVPSVTPRLLYEWR